MKSAARLNDEPSGPVARDNIFRALVKIAVASAWRRSLDFCSGSIASFRPWFGHFRSAPMNGHSQTAPACRKCATSRSRGRTTHTSLLRRRNQSAICCNYPAVAPTHDRVNPPNAGHCIAAHCHPHPVGPSEHRRCASNVKNRPTLNSCRSCLWRRRDRPSLGQANVCMDSLRDCT